MSVSEAEFDDTFGPFTCTTTNHNNDNKVSYNPSASYESRVNNKNNDNSHEATTDIVIPLKNSKVSSLQTNIMTIPTINQHKVNVNGVNLHFMDRIPKKKKLKHHHRDYHYDNYYNKNMDSPKNKSLTSNRDKSKSVSPKKEKLKSFSPKTIPRRRLSLSKKERNSISEEKKVIQRKKITSSPKPKKFTSPKFKKSMSPKQKMKASLKNIKVHKNTKVIKKLDKIERIVSAMQSFLWWDAADPPVGSQWCTMEHAGVSFTDSYISHGICLLYGGLPINLNPVEEEAATFFASMDPEGMHLGNPKTRDVFIKNFFSDFSSILDPKHGINEFEKCDFEPIRKYLNDQKIIKKAITDEQKSIRKQERNEVIFKYGYAIVDGHLEKVGNYNMEPPGAFRGRGEHPKMGKLKQRVYPEQVFLNMSECAPIPQCSVPGHGWGELRHDPQVQWLAQWKENINNQSKYMQLAAQSSFKGKSDRSKYNKAAKLCGYIDTIRSNYKRQLRDKTMFLRQLGTAIWVIDRLALRVGGEKDTEEEADTVGCCSLRVEHLHFDPAEEGKRNKEIELEFLGKDSMLYKQTIDFGATMYNENNGMGQQVYDNLHLFCQKKQPCQEVFDLLTPSVLNQHLKEMMEDLTAKVFRTYNASKTLQDELRKTENMGTWKNLTPAQKVVEYNNANREVAILCNHQRTVSKAQETSLENLSEKLKMLKKQKKQLKNILKNVKSGMKVKFFVKKDEAKLAENVKKAMSKAKDKKEEAKTNEEKFAAIEAEENMKKMKRDLSDLKFKQAHLWDKTPSQDQVRKKITSWTQKIAKMELDLKLKDDNKEVSLGTSKLNYMDPRISVAWCKRNEVPIEKIFSKTLRDKFNWSMAVIFNWEFNSEIGKQG